MKNNINSYFYHLISKSRTTFPLADFLQATGLREAEGRKILSICEDEGYVMPFHNKQKFKFFSNPFTKPVVDKIQQTQMQCSFSKKLDLSYYYAYPYHIFQAELPYLQKLSLWLKQTEGRTIPFKSGQDRANEIFGDEKFFLHGIGRKILSHVKLSIQDLRIAENPEPWLFFLLKPLVKTEEMHHLIVENKAPLFTIAKLAPEITNLAFHTVIWGHGCTIDRTENPDVFLLQLQAQHQSHHFYYWGDLDKKGIEIWYLLKKKIPDLQLALLFYQKMLHTPLPAGKKNQRVKKEYLQAFCQSFSEEQQQKISAILKENAYIPQENLGEEELRCLLSYPNKIKRDS